LDVPGGICSTRATGTKRGIGRALRGRPGATRRSGLLTMLSDYRLWLDSELKLLGNASHHAYSFGQANMAKRAIDRLDQELENKVALLIERPQAAALLASLEARAAASDLDAPLAALRLQIAAALAPGGAT
jgi:hypothetical protein